MQYFNTSVHKIDDESLLFSPGTKKTKLRKWREIEEIKARQKLCKELYEIDQSFELSSNDLL